MTTPRLDNAHPEWPTLTVHGPADLLQAVPYLLGFHPQASLVLVGLDNWRLVVTVRLDLADAQLPGVLADALQAMARGGAGDVVAAVYDDEAIVGRQRPLPWIDVALAVGDHARDACCGVVDVLLVARQRWWSYACTLSDCCPVEGEPLPEGTSAFTAAATYAGLVALPDRAALAAVLDPYPQAERDAMDTTLAACEDAAVQAVLDGNRATHDRSVKRALFAAARAADEARWSATAIDDPGAARFGVALSEYPMRDALWMAVDDGRLDGRELWRELAARLPHPYDAAPLFLYAWASWRAGNGALARIAAERAIEADPGYSAADLLLAALSRGVDPRRLPRLRHTRTA